MPKKEKKAAHSTKAVDVFEAWLEKQKARPVGAKPGFTSREG